MPSGIAVSADFTSQTQATLTMSPSDLHVLIKMCRGLRDYFSSTMNAQQLQLLQTIADISVPSDSD